MKSILKQLTLLIQMNPTNKRIPWWEPTIGQHELPLVKKALENHFPNEGPLTTQFEKCVAKLLNVKYAIATTSGTTAIFLALKACGVTHGDEVIVPDMTFIATANAAELCGAKVVLVDVEKERITIDPQKIKQAITPKTKAIVPVHPNGRAANMQEILALAKQYNLAVVEDAAEGFMSKHEGKYLGTFGNAGCFSFSPHKIITTGQGGMIVTDDENVYLAIKKLKDQGRPKRGSGGDDIHESIGYNFKYTDLQAAVGLGQLEYVQDRINNIKLLHDQYKKNLKDINDISFIPIDIENDEIPIWVDITLESRDKLDEYLHQNNIDCRRYWFPLHTQKPYKQSDDSFPVSIQLSKTALWLPSAYTLTSKDVDHVSTFITSQEWR